MKRLNLRWLLEGQLLRALSAAVFLLSCPSAGAQLYYDARGTGRTTGAVASVRVYNPTPTPMRVVLGDCFIPAASGHQGYVIPQTYPVEVAPLGSAVVLLEGYCVNVGQPPAPEGSLLPDVSQWVSWAAAAPLPEAGKPLGPPFVLVAAVPDDPLALTYPGTQTPMPYSLDFNRFPQYGARLLLHAAYAAAMAFDQLAREGKIKVASTGRPLQSFRQDIIQQNIWAYAARLEGKTYGKGHFHTELLEEAEHQLNQPAGAFAPDVRQALDRQSQDVWASVSLVGAAAKLVPPSTDPHLETLHAEPTGPPIEIGTALLDRLRNTPPTQPDAIERLTPVQVFLQSHGDAPEYQALALASVEKWRAALQHLTDRIDPQSPTAVRDALTTIGWLQSPPSQSIPLEERQRLLTTLHGKTSAALQHTATVLHPQQPNFLAQWRALKAIADQSWYDTCCRQTNPLLKLPDPMDAVRAAAPFQPAALPLTGGQWKHTAPLTTPVAGPRKSPPWWIGGIPIAGTAVYLATRKRAQPASPPPPIAVGDTVSLNCGEQTTIFPLDNDSGVRIALNGIGASPPGLGGFSTMDNALNIFAAGTGVFSLSYTIRDSLGRTASATIVITVLDTGPPTITCPPAITISCDKEPNTALTGQASATDDCPPGPTVTFSDQTLGPPCIRLILRTWRATDTAGKTAVCTQNIQVRDVEPPIFTITPPNIIVALGQQNNLDITGRARAADACHPLDADPFFTDSDLGPCGGTLLRTWMANDECGNTATYLQTITVVDPTPPTITCPPPADVACGKQYDLEITGRATAVDNCADTVFITYSDNPPAFTGCNGKIRRTWTGSDPAGNAGSCTQDVSVTDSSPPTIVCPSNVTVPCGQEHNLNVTGRAEAKDACGNGATIEHTDQLTVFPACINFITGQILRTFRSADSCGNAMTCSQTIALRDQTPPAITCPSLVQVQCGQQNNLTTTGRATATDNCGGPVTITHSDNTSEFVHCSGVIYRTFAATDPCGHVAVCVQSIVVVNVPCNFTATLSVNTPVCGRCVGGINTTVSPAGSYTYLWNTGHSTPNLSNVCPGNYTVSITNLSQECTDIYSVTVGNNPRLTLTVVQVIPPTFPTSNNGRVVLQVSPPPPASIPPFLVFVNGAPIGNANTNTFQITNMPPGEYVIWVMDQSGNGCLSNEVLVFLIPGLASPPPLNLNAGGPPMTLPAISGPEHPASTPARFWPAAPGLSLTLPVAPSGQVRFEYQPYLSLSPSSVPVVSAEQFSAGYRRYSSHLRRSEWQLFSEMLLALTHLLPASPAAVRRQLPQIAASGGTEGRLGRYLCVEAGMRLTFLPTLPRDRYQWSAYLRASVPLQKQQQPVRIPPIETRPR
jgi:hypothetical protein